MSKGLPACGGRRGSTPGLAGGTGVRRQRGARIRGRRLPPRVPRGILAVALAIGLGLPGAYYAYGLRTLRDLVGLRAQELAHQLVAGLPKIPRPEGASPPAIHTILLDLRALPPQPGMRVQLLDQTGRPISPPGSVSPARRFWPSLPSLIGTAPIMLRRQPLGQVEVQASQENLLTEASAFFVVCALASISMVILLARSSKKRSGGRTRAALRQTSPLPPSAEQVGGRRLPVRLRRIPESR